jgi:hypothetical protein
LAEAAINLLRARLSKVAAECHLLKCAVCLRYEPGDRWRMNGLIAIFCRAWQFETLLARVFVLVTTAEPGVRIEQIDVIRESSSFAANVARL